MIFVLAWSAFTKAAQLEIAQSGFKCTGIFPLDRNIFCDLDNLPSMITGIPIEFEPSTVNNTLTCTTQQHLIASNPIAPTTTPITSTLSKISVSSKSDTKSAITYVLHVLSPIPNVYQNRINTRSKTQRSEILTSSPSAKQLILENVKLLSILTKSKKMTKYKAKLKKQAKHATC